MAVTVPSTDVVNYNLQTSITNVTAEIANATIALNGPLVLALNKQLAQLNLALVLGLLGQGSISASSILAGNAQTYTAATPGAGGLN
jgi:hypothetical protein